MKLIQHPRSSCITTLETNQNTNWHHRCQTNNFQKQRPTTQQSRRILNPRSTSTQHDAAWDPEGILPPSLAGGHFARREQQQKPPPSPVDAQLPLHLPPIVPVPKDQFPEGIDASNTSAYDKKSLGKKLSQRYMPFNLDYPNVTILHMEPPVFLIKDFFTEKECESLVNAAIETGKMAASKIGSGNVTDLSSAMSSRRTSTSILVDASMQKEFPRLGDIAQSLQRKGKKLLGADTMSMPWGRPGKLPLLGQYCFEALQVAQYQQGQYFLEHEDAFPIDEAHINGFQRSATLLVYLCNVEKGGATKFEHLDLAVKPVRGTALVFFPAFSDGTPDSRTLHTAEPAQDIKSVTQQWIAQGVGALKKSNEKTKSTADVEVLLKGKGKRKISVKKGFGSS